MRLIFLSVLCFYHILTVVDASSILFFHLAGTVSHRTSIWPLAEKLADKGHNVTYIFPLNRKVSTHPNIEEITPSKMVPVLEKNIDYDINFRLNNSNHLILQNAFQMCFDLCTAFYDSPEIQEWINRPDLHYDLIMIDSSMGECIYGVVHKLKSKHVIFVPAFVPYHWDGFGIVPESSSIPNTFTFLGYPSKPNQMDLMARFWTTIENLVWRFGYSDFANKIHGLIEERMNITGLPHLSEFERNTSLVLANTHFVEDYPYALPPMVVSYSGLSCSKDKLKDRKPLPDSLAKFVEGKDSDGFVYISFGSAVVSSAMPVELRASFFEGIEAFPKLKFLWRWTGDVPKYTPDNLIVREWFPQNDVLAHPKIKGFMTQCGRPSTQEALCNGVPLITLPVFADQDYNSDRLEYIGASINIDINNLTVDSFKEAIREIVYTDKYKNQMAKLSSMFKDRPVDPLENAVYWTEYVLRHDTTLLKPLSISQTWYQRRLLDVYLVIAGVLLTASAALVLVIFLVFKYSLRLFGPSGGVTNKRKIE